MLLRRVPRRREIAFHGKRVKRETRAGSRREMGEKRTASLETLRILARRYLRDPHPELRRKPSIAYSRRTDNGGFSSNRVSPKPAFAAAFKFGRAPSIKTD
ncbi:hypothetical protein DMN91_003615 [Ooceraea biroi]|uniref:Uncharacterized protein n=1 Tax=Ooceraea biroi TaxID=2015173 RepID=A0A3L8DSM4_OOCBI|nr:hypothetical protein DMN91_003615 [Ooceraea biroi]